jgi:hypothetical protein
VFGAWRNSLHVSTADVGQIPHPFQIRPWSSLAHSCTRGTPPELATTMQHPAVSVEARRHVYIAGRAGANKLRSQCRRQAPTAPPRPWLRQLLNPIMNTNPITLLWDTSYSIPCRQMRWRDKHRDARQNLAPRVVLRFACFHTKAWASMYLPKLDWLMTTCRPSSCPRMM